MTATYFKGTSGWMVADRFTLADVALGTLVVMLEWANFPFAVCRMRSSSYPPPLTPPAFCRILRSKHTWRCSSRSRGLSARSSSACLIKRALRGMEGLLPAPIHTARLVIRPLNADLDWHMVRDVLTSDDFVRFVGSRNVDDEVSARQYVDATNAFLSGGGHGSRCVALATTGEPVGLVGWYRRPSLQHDDLGWGLAPQHTRQGYMREAAKALLDAVPPGTTVLAVIHPDNARSIRLAEALGFVATGRQMDSGPSCVWQTNL